VSSIRIEDFLFDETNDEKFAEHGLTDKSVLQILQTPFVILRNRRNRRAAYLVIGRDFGGQCIAVPIEPTHEPTVWRPVTAWRCKRGEETLLNNATR